MEHGHLRDVVSAPAARRDDPADGGRRSHLPRALALAAWVATGALVGRDLAVHHEADAAWARMRARQAPSPVGRTGGGSGEGDAVATSRDVARRASPTYDPAPAAYDAARSDALYEAVWQAREALRRDAVWFGLALLALAALSGAPQSPAPLDGAHPRAPRRAALRALGRTAVDGAPALIVAAAGIAAAESLGRGGSEAAVALLERLWPWLAAAASAWTIRPAAPVRAAALRRAVGGVAALGALLLLPFTAPVALLVATRAPRLAQKLAAPHRALAGLD
jgi:hypothetical protein